MSGAAVNSFDHFGWTPLHEAANHGDVPTIKALLKHPSTEVNTVGGHEVKKLGMTPLHDAAGEPPSQRLSFFGGKGKKNVWGVRMGGAGRHPPSTASWSLILSFGRPHTISFCLTVRPPPCFSLQATGTPRYDHLWPVFTYIPLVFGGGFWFILFGTIPSPVTCQFCFSLSALCFLNILDVVLTPLATPPFPVLRWIFTKVMVVIVRRLRWCSS